MNIQIFGTKKSADTRTPEQDIKIEICDKNMENVLYTQGAHFKNAGYYTVELTEPMDVDGFAVAVTYGFDAPAEGEGVEDWIRFIPNYRISGWTESGRIPRIQQQPGLQDWV